MCLDSTHSSSSTTTAEDTFAHLTARLRPLGSGSLWATHDPPGLSCSLAHKRLCPSPLHLYALALALTLTRRRALAARTRSLTLQPCLLSPSSPLLTHAPLSDPIARQPLSARQPAARSSTHRRRGLFTRFFPNRAFPYSAIRLPC